ncbi:MAG: Ig-like domain-containing protein [Sedimentisphaerales bacterium]|nr:Ig-like domain-containing protein [Sedimentisphaerales bacterium]
MFNFFTSRSKSTGRTIMMIKSRRFILLLALWQTIIFTAGVSSVLANNEDANVSDNTSNIAIELNTSALTFARPDLSQQLTAIVTGTSITDVTWTCADEYIASVSSDGTVTSVAGGTVAITATSTVDSSKSAVCMVTVNEPNRAETTDVTAPDTISGSNIEIIMCGDSLMRTYSTSYGADQCGWGQMLQDFFDNNVTVNNTISEGGRSTRSFYNENVRWPAVKSILAANKSAGKPSFVFFQFGHNDQKLATGNGHEYLTFAMANQNGTVAGTYYDYLERYIVETRQLGGIPVFFTPFVRRYYSNGEVTEKGKHNLLEVYSGESKCRGNYPAAMKAVAAKHSVPVIDITGWSEELIEDLYASEGEDSAADFIYSSDNTHTRTLGAIKHAEAAAQGLYDRGILDQYIIKPDPRLMLDAGKKAFGNLVIGKVNPLKNYKNFKMTNYKVTDGTLTISSDSPYFTISDNKDGTYSNELTIDCSLTGKTVYIKFVPDAAIDYTATLRATYSGTKTIIPDFGTSTPGTIDGTSACIALSGTGIEYIPYTGSKYILNVGDLEPETLQDGLTLGTADYYTINGTPVAQVNKKTVNGVTYTKRLKTANPSNSISFTTSNKASVYTVCISSSSSAIRILNVFDRLNNILETFEIPGHSAIGITFTVPAAGTYTLASAFGGINFYYFEVNENE